MLDISFIILILVQTTIIQGSALGLGCPAICPANYLPICGSDGVTYSNACELMLRNCRQSRSPVTRVFEGECARPAEEKRCPDRCPENFAPVCGSDGNTHSNQCAFDVHNCNNGGSLKIANIGECSSVPEKQCPEACGFNLDPVCGSDGETYSNQCAFEVQNCNIGGSLRIAHKGECRKKTCSENCALVYSPVCGTDGITYGNLCQLEADNCKNIQASVFVAYAGECRQNLEAQCTSGSIWKLQCNWCRCSFGTAACTKRRCLPGDSSLDPSEPTCYPGSQWRQNNSWCSCASGQPACVQHIVK